MFDFRNHSEAISIEHIYTDYYLNYEISINKTNVNRNASDHAIHVNKHNHSMKQTSNAIYRLKRFLAFLSFFILFLLLITILSKLYACLTKMKLRKKRYGFYLNYKMEKFITDCRNKIKYKKLKIETKFEPKQQQLVINIYSKDLGHVNESFDTSNELIMIDDNKQQPVITPHNKQTNFLTKYLETKRINSFEYEKFKNEDDDFTSLQDKKEYNIVMKLFKKSKLKYDKSIPLFTFSNEKKKFLNDLTQSTSSFIYKNSNSSSSSNMTTSSFSTVSTTASTFEIPLIYITDTTKMQTNIIDLETFEPENCRKTQYKSNNRRPI